MSRLFAWIVVLLLLGGCWGLLMGVLIPGIWGMIPAIVGGAIIGWLWAKYIWRLIL